MFKLFDFQQQLVDEIYESWDAGYQNVCAVSETGSGKTVVFSHIIHEFQGASVAIAHRQELVSQISLALARNGIRHRAIAPKNVIGLCIDLHMAETGKSYYDVNSQCAVAGVDTLIRMDANDRWFKQVGLWVLDECFAAGTLVDGRPIESLKIGDYVTAFDDANSTFEQRKITHVFKNPAPKNMMRIETKTHHVLYCTMNHPFWTNRGWIEAGQLTINDEVLNYEMYPMWESNHANKRSATLSIEKNRSHILYKKMRPVIQRSTSEAKGKNRTILRDTRNVSCLPTTSRLVKTSIPAIFKDRSCLLWARMRNGLSQSCFLDNCDKNQFKICVGPDENKKSYAESRIDRENEIYTTRDWTQTNHSRWQWKTASGGRNGVIQFGLSSGFCSTSCYKNQYKTEQQSRQLSNQLQTGCRSCWFKNSNRSRWLFARSIGKESARCKENQMSDWVGLESIAIHESADIRGTHDGYVYNIEVDGLHTYVANGIVTHNCHHLLLKNKWGKAIQMFPNAKGLGVTATPLRADGRGLGRHADGLFDVMIQAPGMRELITRGFLSDYMIYAPQTDDLDLSTVKLGADGDYSQPGLRDAMHKSKKIYGNTVDQYLKTAAGKIGVTFCVDIESAEDQAAAFRQQGIPAEMVSSRSTDAHRLSCIARLRRGDLKQLTNVCLFDEGFDLPAIEVVSMTRPTFSLALARQQMGRALRRKDGKKYGIINDHVNNILLRHGLPDKIIKWTLDSRERSGRGASDPTIVQVRTCPECTAVYERVLGRVCPYCGHTAKPISRTLPEHVDGDLQLLTPEFIAKLQGNIDKTRGESTYPWGATQIIVNSIDKRHREHLASLDKLREAIATWAAGMHDIPRAQRQFYLTFGVDVLSAQALPRKEADKLIERIYDNK